MSLNNTSSTTLTHAQQLQPTLLKRRQVENLTTLSRSRIYALMAEGSFPRQVSLGSMSVVWLESEVNDWIADRIADSRKKAGV